ncbi:MAG: hypothetical protein ABSF52_04715 [Syntrophobacteraceae bacterium]|jgi:hypothetical protein
MLQGKDLLLPPYNLTRSGLFALVRAGKLVPYRKYSSLYPDPTEPPGCGRILPRHDQREIYGKLRWARYQREWIQDWLAKSPEERQTDPRSSPPSDQEYGEQLRQHEIEIPGCENKLDPAQVWQGEFSPREQEELFNSLVEDAWYLDNDIQNCATAERKPMLLDKILLEPEQKELLCKLIEAERSSPNRPRGKFFVAEGMGFEGALFHYTEGGAEVTGSLADAEILAQAGLLGLSYHSSRGNAMFHIRPTALQYYRELKTIVQPAEAVEEEIRGYIFSNNFKQVFPKAFEKWSQAESLLWESESEKQFTTIGHLCREALQEFADVLVKKHQITDISDKGKDISRIAAVLKQKASLLGSKESDFLRQLLNYWAAVSELVQRQEHGAQKEGEPLNWEDGRRVVFQTMIVMYEVHRSLSK